MTSEPAPTAEVPAPLARAQVGVCLSCGFIILVSFLALGYTVVRSDRLFSNDPAAVEATLQSLVTCQIPSGYRGFMAADVPGQQRIAVVAPTGLEGKRLDLSVPLLISAWTFPPEAKTAQARADAVIAFWDSQVLERELVLGKKQKRSKKVTALRARDQEHPGFEVVYACERVTVRLVFAELPQTGRAEPMVLAFVGDQEAFDEASMQAFLESVR